MSTNYAGDPLAPPDTIPVLDDGDAADAATWGVALEGLMDLGQYLKRGAVYHMTDANALITWRDASLVVIPTITANRVLRLDDGPGDPPPDGHIIRIQRIVTTTFEVDVIRSEGTPSGIMATFGVQTLRTPMFLEVMWDGVTGWWRPFAWSIDVEPIFTT